MTEPAGIYRLLDNNRQWAEMVERTRPGLLADLAKQQAPGYLWIGCADSRVPANEIVGLAPGELFVHRNIANLVQHGDLNCLSVLQFAIDQLQVRDIILCGHYGCSGVRAALREEGLGISEHWLHPLRDLAHRHQSELNALEDENARVDRLCELNVLEQVRNLCRIPIVRRAWQRGQNLSIHSWIYGLRDGLVRTLSPALDGPTPYPAGL
ncbi:carbonic anhydrase [Magnetospirillum fulvum]|uniref:Carbonic anhydrase 2 n=1 Tax=Magnetospirillum fulvum MGU-K5 TaxID=1316936 RepID=S9SA82_MAGFU|nr:carbonic anhydrase [Magnetospirillum fulvum]EPY02817.1 carbonic anhydrase [Magnetospirillum fulvum MGU-K5]